MKNKNVYIIAGPNGAGKTTFAKRFLPQYAKCPHFVNADLIAQGLSPFSPRIAAMKAGRLVLEQIQDMADKNVDFAFETTLSGKAYVDFLKTLKKRDYRLHLFFLWVPSPELALARIKGRVAEGGHDVPAEDVRRRFDRGIQNLFRFYKPLLDSWMFFDNAGNIPRLIAEEKDGKLLIMDKDLYDTVTRGA
ncbi:MAG: zeta toxin family protein, partial [Candidatus Omnitrophica bacterium]|nr:zeta toxin family protein [Candidatus Omnitrophota bacterium]